MIDIILDTVIDLLKLLPFLFLTFLLMEFLEHKMNKKTKEVIKKSGRFGPLIGSVLGAFPQCGFSVSATNLYVTRIISLGTLIAIYLSTSDEMLPILISEKVNLSIIVTLILIKIIIGIIAGFIIDFIYKKKSEVDIKDFCHDNHCDCNHGIIKPAIKHTFNILIFIGLVSFILNIGFEFLGEDNISKLFMKDSIFAPFISSLVGLIPNCGASVVLTELYLKGTISTASVIAGLLTSSGVALLVLFRVNKNLKENITILSLVYFVGAIVGVLMQFIGVHI